MGVTGGTVVCILPAETLAGEVGAAMCARACIEFFGPRFRDACQALAEREAGRCYARRWIPQTSHIHS